MDYSKMFDSSPHNRVEYQNMFDNIPPKNKPIAKPEERKPTDLFANVPRSTKIPTETIKEAPPSGLFAAIPPKQKVPPTQTGTATTHFVDAFKSPPKVAKPSTPSPMPRSTNIGDMFGNMPERKPDKVTVSVTPAEAGWQKSNAVDDLSAFNAWVAMNPDYNVSAKRLAYMFHQLNQCNDVMSISDFQGEWLNKTSEMTTTANKVAEDITKLLTRLTSFKQLGIDAISLMLPTQTKGWLGGIKTVPCEDPAGKGQLAIDRLGTIGPAFNDIKQELPFILPRIQKTKEQIAQLVPALLEITAVFAYAMTLQNQFAKMYQMRFDLFVNSVNLLKISTNQVVDLEDQFTSILSQAETMIHVNIPTWVTTIRQVIMTKAVTPDVETQLSTILTSLGDKK